MFSKSTLLVLSSLYPGGLPAAAGSLRDMSEQDAYALDDYCSIARRFKGSNGIFEGIIILLL
jgi:hypothetical protein